MVAINALVLPILLSAVLVFFVSYLIHMALPWHRNDYARVPNEAGVMDALRSFAIPPGDYILPHAPSARDMCTPEFIEKMKQGPVMVLTVAPNGPVAMGKKLLAWFIYCLVIGVLAAYVAGRALPAGAHYLNVFQFAGVAAFLGYSFAHWPMAIWYRRSLSTTIKETIDGLIYALVTAGAFGWLWPR